MKKISTLRNMVMLMLALFLVIGNVFATKGWKRVTHNTTLAAGIFFRYYLIQKGDFSLYAEAEPYFGTTSSKIEGTYKNLKGET